MSTLNQPLFLIRRVGTEDYESGYGKNSSPMLYTRNAANSVVGRNNKRVAEDDARWPDSGPRARYEAVPVKLVIDTLV